MKIEHIAFWTSDPEKIKEYYKTYFQATSSEKYRNETRQFESYFLSFETGCRLEIMSVPDIQDAENDRLSKPYRGLTHVAFEVETMKEVDEKAKELKEAGFEILRGPRVTGDGYYEFETLDPDNNKLEVTTIYRENPE
ncbi:MAG: VOC family protein [Candidatus Azobacteroides sp.]|nr:VOC family protein [Candidatus Azobacteroides sp.]